VRLDVLDRVDEVAEGDDAKPARVRRSIFG
jgi:hypothetical protein